MPPNNNAHITIPRIATTRLMILTTFEALIIPASGWYETPSIFFLSELTKNIAGIVKINPQQPIIPQVLAAAESTVTIPKMANTYPATAFV